MRVQVNGEIVGSREGGIALYGNGVQFGVDELPVVVVAQILSAVKVFGQRTRFGHGFIGLLPDGTSAPNRGIGIDI